MKTLKLIFVLCFLTQLSAREEPSHKQPIQLRLGTETEAAQEKARAECGSGKAIPIMFIIQSEPDIQI